MGKTFLIKQICRLYDYPGYNIVIVAQQQIPTAVQAVSLLHEVFGIDVPQGDAVLARLDAVLNPAS